MTYRYLTRPQAADYLTDHGFPCRPKTLAKHACQGGGPRYIKYGLRTLYRPEDLLTWAASQSRVQSSTSDPGEPLDPICPSERPHGPSDAPSSSNLEEPCGAEDQAEGDAS